MFLMFETWHHCISQPRRWLWIDGPPAHHLCRLGGLAHPIGQAKVGSTTVWHAFRCICWARHRRIEKEIDRESSRARERERAREKETRTHLNTFIDLTHTYLDPHNNPTNDTNTTCIQHAKDLRIHMQKAGYIALGLAFTARGPLPRPVIFWISERSWSWVHWWLLKEWQKRWLAQLAQNPATHAGQPMKPIVPNPKSTNIWLLEDHTPASYSGCCMDADLHRWCSSSSPPSS